MCKLRLKIISKQDRTIAVGHSSGYGTSILHTSQYLDGDRIVLDTTGHGGLYALRLDEALPEAIVYLDGTECIFPIPAEDVRGCYSPKAFSGSCHLITAREANIDEINTHRNLAFNPYDHHTTVGIYPHASANVETRNEAVFAARNAIDGIFENASHGIYPYSSWGINRNPCAELRLEFGRAVMIDSLRITLRADFPHDNWWTSATVCFSDGSSETLEMTKTELPQIFDLTPRISESLTFGKLIQSPDTSPFPALTQLEVYGCDRSLVL